MSKYEFKLPDLGEGMVESEIGEWFIKVGDQVTEEDLVCTMMTDKAAIIVRPTMQSTRTQAHSVQFQLTGFPNGNRWTSDERMGATVIETRDNYVFKVVDTSAGFLFTDVLA